MTAPLGKLQKLLFWSQLFFFFSGSTGLVYQVLWTRRLTLTFGHTVLAVSTVLTAFMAGLAIGSFAAGRLCDSRRFSGRSPSFFLAVYGYLEVFVGLWALLSLWLLTWAEQFYVNLASSGWTGASLHIACFFAASVVLIPPTAAMGSTVPILSKLLVQREEKVGPILSRLYGLNTLGAFTGAALAGFFLLPNLGLFYTMTLGTLINVIVGVGAVVTSRRLSFKTRRDPDQEIEQSVSSWKSSLIPLTFAVSGAASLAFQVAWNRTICLAIGSSIYAFSTILVTFLAGLGLGSLAYARLMKGRTVKPSHLAWLYFAVGAAGLATIPAVVLLPIVFLELFPYVAGSYFRVIVANVLITGMLLFLPTLLMGLGFPLATAAYSSSLKSLGRSVGNVYGANTLGCIVGSFLTGFVIIPKFGAQQAMQAATLAYLLSGLILCLAFDFTRRRLYGGLVAALAVLTLTVPPWDTSVMAAGVAIYARNSLHTGPDYRDPYKEMHRPTIYLDGLSSAVSFHLGGEFWDNPHMRVNGKVDASREGDRLTQYMLGYLPCFLHPAPKRVGVIGLGGGFTVEAAAQVPGVEEIHCAELEPAVVAVGEYWKPFNGAVLDDPRVTVHINDGRTFVLASRENFDVLISEPSNPWIAGIGNLFTRDFYQRARGRLNPDGIMCQWFNLYSISMDDMKMVIRSFYDVFPEGHLWMSSAGDLIMIGAAHPAPMDIERIRRAWGESETIRRHFFETHLGHPDSFPGHFVMTREQALQLVGAGPFNTDDKPLLEFSAPMSLYNIHSYGRNVETLLAASDLSLPPGVKALPDAQVRGLVGIANREDWLNLENSLKKLGNSHPLTYLMACRLRRAKDGTDEDIRKIYRGAAKAFPDDCLIAARWAFFEADLRNFEQAAKLCLVALADPPPGSKKGLQFKVGEALYSSGDSRRAVRPLLQSAEFDLNDSTPLSLAGAALVDLQQDEAALTVLSEAIKRNPNDPLALIHLSFAHFNTGNPEKARDALERFLELVPESAIGWVKLGYCLNALDDKSGSLKAFERALELDPDHTAAQEAIEELHLR